ncbi:MAG: hypothetical protein IIZ67_05410 [Bacilli bacterium]|nr:hypothetical protein [Bacilli bacterium]
MNKNQSIKDLIFSPEYPYHWEELNKDGTTSIIFAKAPNVIPSLVDEKKYKELNFKVLIKKDCIEILEGDKENE